MELTTALVLFSFIAVSGYLANKLIDRKYGTKPNQELLDKIARIQHELDRVIPQYFNNVRDRFTPIEKKLEGIDTELEKMSARIDGVQIKKAFNLDKQVVNHL